MSFDLSPSLILQALTIGGLMHAARVMWKTSHVIERLDERTVQHDRRITHLEDRMDAA